VGGERQREKEDLSHNLEIPNPKWGEIKLSTQARTLVIQ